MSDNKVTEQNVEAEEKAQKPQGVLRVSGLAALVSIIAVGGIGSYVFAGDIAKFALKQGMETSFGAQTDIESVDVSWSPFGLTVNKLAQTDASEPSQNLFQLDKLSAQVDLWQMLLGKYVMERVDIERIAMSTPRTEPGEVYKSLVEQAQLDKLPEKSAELGLSVPTSEQLLAALDLETEKKGRALEQTWQQEKPKLEQAFKQLPNKETVAELKKQWQKLSSTDIKSLEDIAQLEKQLKQIKVSVDKEKAALKQAKEQYQQSKAKLDLAYDELQQAAKNDWNKVEQQVPFNDPNAVAIAKMLFGPEVASYVETAQVLWLKAQPYIEQHKQEKAQEQQQQEQKWNSGKDIEFASTNKLPSWLVKELNVSAVIADNVYQVSGSDINIESYVLGKPSIYQVTLADEFKLDGSYFVDESLQLDTSGKWHANGLPLASKSLAKSEDLTLSLSSALLNGAGSFQYNKSLTSNNQFGFSKTDFVGNATTKLAKLTLDTLKDVNSFNLDVDVAGQLKDPSVNVKSDLDRQLGSGLKSALSTEWTQVKDKTQAKLQSQLQQQFNLDDTEYAKYSDIISGFDKDFDAFGSGSVDDVVKQLKKKYEDKLKNKAKDKLKDKLKDLFGGS